MVSVKALECIWPGCRESSSLMEEADVHKV